MDKMVESIVDGGYECTSEVLGYKKDEVKTVKFLGRRISLTDDGIEWEGDPRHAEAFVAKLAA